MTLRTVVQALHPYFPAQKLDTVQIQVLQVMHMYMYIPFLESILTPIDIDNQDQVT